MKTILITLIYLSGAFSASEVRSPEWRRLVEAGTGTKVEIVKTIRRSNFAPELDTLTDWRTKKASRVLRWLRNQRTQGIRVVIMPPIIDSGTRYIAGLAGVCRPKDGWAFTWLQDVNVKGEDRRYASQVVVAHEVGHALGASHDDSLPATTMHPAAASSGILHSNMTFSARSQMEISWCLFRSQMRGGR